MKPVKLFSFLVIALALVGCTSTSSNTNSSSNTSTNQVYSAAEVAKHSSASDCWMIVNGGVYDVTDYVGSHPGGNAMLAGCGKDATNYFTGKDDSGRKHSPAAEQILGEYKIGVEG